MKESKPIPVQMLETTIQRLDKIVKNHPGTTRNGMVRYLLEIWLNRVELTENWEGKNKQLPVRLPQHLIDRLDAVVDQYPGSTRAGLIRYLVEMFLSDVEKKQHDAMPDWELIMARLDGRTSISKTDPFDSNCVPPSVDLLTPSVSSDLPANNRDNVPNEPTDAPSIVVSRAPKKRPQARKSNPRA